ncbi:MAG: Uma2 family endonuclease [Flavisolibacter sp.]|nr:Uma2 family endonuclease [Flavisolibacter sp.]
MGLISGRKKTAGRKKAPDTFIYEIIDDKPLYYKGYREAIRAKQNAESVMGSGTLQAVIISYLLQILYRVCGTENYYIFSGEPGIHIDHKNNLAGDILVYDKTVLPVSKISGQYADVPAELHIEVDIQAEMEDMTEMGYIKRKTDMLLQFGTRKLIWVFTTTQQVMVAEKDKDWLWIAWKKPVPLWENATFCIGEFLEKEGIKPGDERGPLA